MSNDEDLSRFPTVGRKVGDEQTQGVIAGGSIAAPAPEPTPTIAENTVKEPAAEPTPAAPTAPAEGGNQEERSPVLPALEEALNTRAVLDYFIDAAANKLTPAEAIQFIHRRSKEIVDIVASSPNVGRFATPDMRAWLETLRNATQNGYANDQYSDRLASQEAFWEQTVSAKGERMGLTKANPGQLTDPDMKTSGEMALIRFTSALSLGSMVNVPLWHSGVWLRLKAPTLTELYGLYNAMISEKVKAGMNTGGVTLLQSSTYFANYIVDFIINNIYSCSIKDWTPEILRKTILLTDLPILTHALACAINPNGYRFEQPCINNPEKCHHIYSYNINLSRIVWHDLRAISEERGVWMAEHKNDVQLQAVLDYQKQYNKPHSIDVDLNGTTTTIVLRTPSIHRYITLGSAWIADCETAVRETMTEEALGNQLYDKVEERMRVGVLRHYSHWVERISNNVAGVVDDTDTICHLLDMLSDSNDITGKLNEEVRLFIDNSTVAIVALPIRDCPKCRAPSGVAYNKAPQLAALDPMQTFFTLLIQRVFRQ